MTRSAKAEAFNRGPHSLEAFTALAKKGADPASAQKLLRELSKVPGGLSTAERKQVSQLTSMPLDRFIAAVPTAPVVAQIFQKRVPELELSALPHITGTVDVFVPKGTQPVPDRQGFLKYPNESINFAAADGRSFVLEADFDSTEQVYGFIPGTDIRAFNHQTVTLQAQAAENPAVLRVMGFAPGTSSGYLEGRIKEGNGVRLNSKNGSNPTIHTPWLVKQFTGATNLGVALPNGDVKDDYWMLVRVMQPFAPVPGKPGVLAAQSEAGLDTLKPIIELPAAEAAKVVLKERMYVKGHFPDSGKDRIVATNASSSAGTPWAAADSPAVDPWRTVLTLTSVSQ